MLSFLFVFCFIYRFFGDKTEIENKSEVQLLIATFNHMRHPYQLLIIPLTMWSGIEQSFFTSDYSVILLQTGQ